MKSVLAPIQAVSADEKLGTEAACSAMSLGASVINPIAVRKATARGIDPELKRDIIHAPLVVGTVEQSAGSACSQLCHHIEFSFRNTAYLNSGCDKSKWVLFSVQTFSI